MAESIGVEPIHRLPSEGLAIPCLAARPTLHKYFFTKAKHEKNYTVIDNIFLCLRHGL